jgi:hypothetical protein
MPDTGFEKLEAPRLVPRRFGSLIWFKLFEIVGLRRLVPGRFYRFRELKKTLDESKP